MAAKLAVGYTLDQIANDITQKTPASFEPSIDYVVTKIPRFTFEKFPGAKAELGTMMKSVGEVMAMGRTWVESFQKAMRGMETGLDGWDLPKNYKRLSKEDVSRMGRGKVGMIFSEGGFLEARALFPHNFFAVPP